jgi:hypothetical protein
MMPSGKMIEIEEGSSAAQANSMLNCELLARKMTYQNAGSWGYIAGVF